MALRTCIICGGPTGSREHIFPAALGGRRTNKGIYCGTHNNEYSGLAGIIAAQLSIFNAQLGVVKDHADVPTSVTMTDVASGQEVELSSKGMRFKNPQLRSERKEGDQTIGDIAFNTRKEAEEWAADLRAKGHHVQFAGEGQRARYLLGTAHKQFTLGGNEEGLRSIAYIAQTFLAHSFPEIARLPEMQGVKDYTLKNIGKDYAWWDFQPPADLPANSFAFGHQIVVGLNSEDGSVYARISLFSTLNFAILLGKADIQESRTAITDIDPLAAAAPDDIVAKNAETAVGAVVRPFDLSASLADAIHNGRAQQLVHDLMRRITDFERDNAAAALLKRAAGAQTLSSRDRDKLFEKLVDGEMQRVLNLMNFVAKDIRQRAANPFEEAMATFMEDNSKLDPAADNGLSVEATKALQVGCAALAKQMSEDCANGKLTQDRMSMLIGGGPGAHAVGSAVMQIFIDRFPK